MLGKVNPAFLGAGVAIFVLSVFSASASTQPATVEELKAQLASARTGDRIQLGIQIAGRQLEAADKVYSAGENEEARTAVGDVASLAEQARGSSIQFPE